MWPTTEDEYVNPPIFKRAPRRPMKLRRRDPHEETTQSYTKGPGSRNKCSRCGVEGHNARSCKNPASSQQGTQQGGAQQEGAQSEVIHQI